MLVKVTIPIKLLPQVQYQHLIGTFFIESSYSTPINSLDLVANLYLSCTCGRGLTGTYYKTMLFLLHSSPGSPCWSCEVI